MAVPRLSIVTCCKGRLEHLKRALPTFVRQNDSEVIVVDYDCPDGTKDWVAAHFPAVRVTSVGEAPILNMSHARNVGARFASAPCLVFCDADQMLTPSLATELLARLAPRTYVLTHRETKSGLVRRPIPLACEAVTFWAVGGYDDAICGWGFEDVELIQRLDRSGIKEALGAQLLVETLPHGNAVRSNFYKHDIGVSAVINHSYVTIKRRFFETRSEWFTDAQRHSTYRLVEQAVLAALAKPEGDAVFDIRIRVADSAAPWTARLTAQAIREFHKIRTEIDTRREWETTRSIIDNADGP